MAKTRQSKAKADTSFSEKLLKIVDWAVILTICAAGIVIVVSYLMPPKAEPSPRVLPDKGSIEVQLFGGCGKGADVLQVAEMLRELGVDVVDVVQQSGQLYPSSLIVDRAGNPLVADSLASLLGLPSDRIVVQRYNLYFHATIVLGLDCPEIIEKLKGITS